MSSSEKPDIPTVDLVRAVGREAQGAHQTAKLIVQMLTEEQSGDGTSVTEQIVALLEQVIVGQRQLSVLVESIASDVSTLKRGQRRVSGGSCLP